MRNLNRARGAAESVAAAPAAHAARPIALSGEEVAQITALLSSPQMFLRQANGAIIPFIDPNVAAAIRMLQAKLPEREAGR